jgi:hypothetical protein
MRRIQMGKNNGHNRQPQPSFFQVQVQKFGPGWMNKVNADYIRKNALKIFKDLSYGAINVDRDYEYFNTYDFTYNLWVAAVDNAKYCFCCYQGLSNNPATPLDIDMTRVMRDHYDRTVLFNSIAVHLNNILMNITQFNGLYTRLYLHQMVADIRWKRNAFNGYFITLAKDSDKRDYLRNERRPQYNEDRNSEIIEGGIWDKPFKDNS